jgi:hypothetical protein
MHGNKETEQGNEDRGKRAKSGGTRYSGIERKGEDGTEVSGAVSIGAFSGVLKRGV